MNWAELHAWMNSGGMTVWIIAAAFVILIIAGIERLNFLYFRNSFQSPESTEGIRQSILTRDYTKAIQICNVAPTMPDFRVIKAGLLAMEHGREAMRSALGGAVLEVSRECEKRIPTLALIAGISTLVGLMGTISGLIRTFSALAVADAAQKAVMLGSGISESMYSTASGLALGIVAMVLHTMCTSKADEIISRAQSSGYSLVTWIEESERITNV